MFTLLILLSQLPIVTLAFPPYTRNLKDPRHAPEEGQYPKLKEANSDAGILGNWTSQVTPNVNVKWHTIKIRVDADVITQIVIGEEGLAVFEFVFASKEEANFFIHRRLLYNRFDLELFLPSDLERECLEEFCNYEEAREIFLDEDKTMEFWKEYSVKGPTTKSDGSGEKTDVIRILIGIIAGGTLLVTSGLFLYYICITRCKRQPYAGCSATYVRNGSFSVNLRRPEEAVASPSAASLEDTGLPSYEQAVELNRKHSVSPPPPYPGLAKGFRVFKKSMSLPSH